MARTDSLANFLTDIANAIRNKKETTEPIIASNFDTEIESIEANTKYAPKYLSFRGFTGTDLTNETANLDTSNITDMSYIFSGCNKLTNIDLSGWNTSNVIDIRGMFSDCKMVKSLNLSNLNTSKVIDMCSMFAQCTGLTSLNLSNLDTSNVSLMDYMFNGCSILTDLNVSGWNTEKVTNMQYMFYSCASLTDLDLSSFDVSKVETLSYMFNGCSKLTNINLGGWDTSNVLSMNYMFSGCNSLIELDLSSFDVSKVVTINSMFGCSKLTNFKSFRNLGKGYTKKSNNYSYYTLNVSSSNLLTHESLMSIINNLYDLNLTYDVANGGTLYTQSLVLGSTNLAKLTAEEIAIATNKGWNVS